ncbi:MAG: hypothetical protein QXU73_00685 [Thermoplasmata archaeon]
MENLEHLRAYDVDAKRGCKLAHDRDILVAAYDESINRFDALEGSAYFTSHSMVFMTQLGYEPLTELSMYFYTRSMELHQRSPNLRFSTNPSVDSQKDYLGDKLHFILSNSVPNSILLVDGPIIAGDVYTTFMSYVPSFFSQGVFPVFFVKNSDSNMVIDNFDDLGKRYNSDLHWCYDHLRPGQRTCLFRYTDRRNPRNTKIFCYMKIMDVSPVRVEFFTESLEQYKGVIPAVFDLVSYLILVQGNLRNPQVRPIAVAEAYAREALKLVNFQRLMRESGLHPTMNQERFAW